MRTVLWVALGQLTGVSLPAEIVIVNKGNGLVVIFVGLMTDMSIKSVVIAGSHRSLQLKIILLNWLSFNLVLGGDDGDFDGVRLGLDRNCLLHVVVGLLHSKEAANLMISHRVLLFACGWNGLHETDHGLVTLGVELAVISGFELSKTILFIILWLLRDVRLYGILEVGEESQAIFELNFEGLVVNGGPGADKVLI